MNANFDDILRRLKAQLNIQQNKKIAELLNMTYDGFYSRRQRNSFPDERLRVLSEQKPEFNLDVDYILTGRRPESPAVDASGQQPRSAVMHIEETTADYDLGPPKEKLLSPGDRKAIAAYYSKLIDDACTKATIHLPMWLSFKLVELLSSRSIDESWAKSLIDLLVSQREDYKYLLKAQFTEESSSLRNELAQKEIEATKAQARAEIVEAKQQLLQSQVDDLKEALKRTEHRLAEAEATLSKVHNQLSTGDKQNKVA